MIKKHVFTCSVYNRQNEMSKMAKRNVQKILTSQR